MRRAVAAAGLAVTLAVVTSGCGGSSRKAAAEAPVHVATARTAAVAPDSALGLQNRFVQVIDAVSPSVVQIETSDGLGSGIVFDGEGDIVTNAHVVGGSHRLVVTLVGGRQYPAAVVGTFPAGDLAVVRLAGVTPRPARFGDSSTIRVGDFVLAIGNPLGLRSSVTEGIVSSLGRTVSEGDGISLQSAIQTSAAINPGNSGGALVNLAGEVIGIPTLAALDPQLGGSQAAGIGFAIPSNTIRTIATQLVEHGRVTASGRAFLGIEASSIMGGGVLVANVETGGPAAKAGIRAGDTIVAVAGQATPTTDVLTSVLARLEPGRRVSVTVARAGRTTVYVTLGQFPG